MASPNVPSQPRHLPVDEASSDISFADGERGHGSLLPQALEGPALGGKWYPAELSLSVEAQGPCLSSGTSLEQILEFLSNIAQNSGLS